MKYLIRLKLERERVNVTNNEEAYLACLRANSAFVIGNLHA